MKKTTLLTRLIYSIFGIYSVFVLCIVYGKYTSNFHINIAKGYLIAVFIFIIYNFIIWGLYLKNTNKFEVKNKILKFILLFIVLTALTHGTNCIFRPQHVDLVRSASIAFGASFGIIFVSDFLLLKNRKE